MADVRHARTLYYMGYMGYMGYFHPTLRARDPVKTGETIEIRRVLD
jgi:hypothetical protein